MTRRTHGNVPRLAQWLVLGATLTACDATDGQHSPLGGAGSSGAGSSGAGSSGTGGNGTAGIGAAGTAGVSGTSGTAGSTTGTSGTAGVSGTTGTAGSSAGAAGASVPPEPIVLPRPSAAAVSAALATELSSFHRNAGTGDIWCTPCSGAPVLLAAAAYAGDTSVDSRLLAQLRKLLAEDQGPFATGGYAANDERNATAMLAIARRTPRIWAQLSATEVEQSDLLMEATLVASAYLTADATNQGEVPAGFDGSTNHNRDWNPNFREGMLGAVLVGTEYFGGQAPTEALLDSYDHVAFTAKLAARGLTNAHYTFSTFEREPSKGAPLPAVVEAGLQGYSLYGMTLGQLLELYLNLADDTFSATVSCGLNDGAGLFFDGVYAGRLVSDCENLPNVGQVGMEKEFDSVDAEGQRSSAGYASLGVRADLMNQLVLVVYGDWRDTPASLASVSRVEVGVTDFFYKAERGYRGYSHASDEGLFQCGADLDCTLTKALWTELLSPYHGR
jgi:hypothetical protein